MFNKHLLGELIDVLWVGSVFLCHTSFRYARIVTVFATILRTCQTDNNSEFLNPIKMPEKLLKRFRRLPVHTLDYLRTRIWLHALSHAGGYATAHQIWKKVDGDSGSSKLGSAIAMAREFPITMVPTIL